MKELMNLYEGDVEPIVNILHRKLHYIMVKKDEKKKTICFIFCIRFVMSTHRGFSLHPEKCFVESTKISIDPYLNEKLC